MRVASVLSLSVLSVSSTAHAIDVGLNGGGCDPSYTTIQDAINASGSGDTIQVATGQTTFESLIINWPLTFEEVADDGWCINNPLASSNVVVKAPAINLHIAEINTTGTVRFEGFTFQDADVGGIGTLGGAVLATGATVECDGCTFFNNAAFVGADIHMVGGALYLVDSFLIGGNAQQGGSLAGQQGADIYLQGSTSVGSAGSYVSTDGGLVFLNDSTLYIEDSAALVNGESGGRGGCVAAILGSDVVVRDNGQIRDCEAGDDGGAIYLRESNLTVTGSGRVSDGIAGRHGGLIYAEDSVMTLWSLGGPVALENGAATLDGGLVFMFDGSELYALHTGASGKLDLRGGTAGGNGGGIYAATGLVSLYGLDVKLFGNTATADGGGVYVTGGAELLVEEDAAIGDPTGNYNAAVRGGAVYASGGTVTLGDGSEEWEAVAGAPASSVTIGGNTATSGGAGIYLHDASTLTARDAIIRSNRARGSSLGFGGGLAVDGGSTAALYDSVFYRNRARARGGAIYVHDGVVELYGIGNPNQDQGVARCAAMNSQDHYCSELWGNESGRPNNTSVGRGGAVYVDTDGTLIAHQVAVRENGAHVDGAQLFFTGNAVATMSNILVKVDGWGGGGGRGMARHVCQHLRRGGDHGGLRPGNLGGLRGEHHLAGHVLGPGRPAERHRLG